MIFSTESLVILIVSIVFGALVSFPSIKIAWRLNLVDFPNSQPHKVHKNPTPLAGGIALFISLILINVFFYQRWDQFINVFSVSAVLVIFITGVIDDKYVLKPQNKLVGQSIASVLLIIGGFRTAIFPQFPYADIIITLLWFIGITNAFNFMDSTDGLVLEISIVISSALIIFTGLSEQFSLQLFSIGFLGILLGVLYFNARPAKLFLGDSGAQLLGMLLAVLTLTYNPLGHDNTSSWISPLLMLFIPVFDVTLVVISRLRKKIPFYQGNLDHTYHRLKRLGHSQVKATLTIIVLVVITNLFAYLILKIDRIFAYLIFVSILVAGAVVIWHFEITDG